MEYTRRAFGRVVGGLATFGFAGCSGGDESNAADVVVGPGGRLVFEPEELTVEVDDTVSWYFDSAGHNVSGRPADSARVQLPDGAEPFASYGPAESKRSLVPPGQTVEHRFGVPGTYQYVCIPHISAGMVGRVVVRG